MKNYLTVILIVTALFVHTKAFQGEVRAKRSFHSYFENYLDEMAMSSCVALSVGRGGLYFPVRRPCKTGLTCNQICTSTTIRKQSQIWDKTKLLNTRCVESFHIYKGRPSLADNIYSDTDTMKVGLTIYRYNSCNSNGCGPNYCCCMGRP